LSDALHEVDGFHPSTDLFARVKRSLEEDEAHRRRLRIVWLTTLGGTALIGWFLGSFVSRGRSGALIIPIWSIELLETALLAALVLLLAPLIRRFGSPFIGDVFRLDPGAGARFLPLLEIAYYLVFSGRVVMTATITGFDRVTLLRPAIEGSLERVSVVLGMMGIMHALTLAGLPLVGLVFSALVRRDARRRAGPAAPPVSARAVEADRLASWIVWLTAGMVIAASLLAVGMAFGIGLGP
jgi:hypothetical protein